MKKLLLIASMLLIALAGCKETPMNTELKPFDVQKDFADNGFTFFTKNLILCSGDTTNLCSHLQRKLFEEDGVYHRLWLAMQDDPELTAVVRSRQLHIYRNGKKILVLAGKSAPKIIREDRITEFAFAYFK